MRFRTGSINCRRRPASTGSWTCTRSSTSRGGGQERPKSEPIARTNVLASTRIEFDETLSAALEDLEVREHVKVAGKLRRWRGAAHQGPKCYTVPADSRTDRHWRLV